VSTRSLLANPSNPRYKYHRVEFDHAFFNEGHIIVRYHGDKNYREVIGHVYCVSNDDKVIYYSTDKNGRKFHHPTTDFNALAMRFERIANLKAIHRKDDLVIPINNNSQNLNKQTMTTSQSNPKQVLNQLHFLEYEKKGPNGQHIAVFDTYKNPIANVQKVYNEEKKKYEYSLFDHAGNFISKSETVWQLKSELIQNRTELLNDAHTRRIEKNTISKNNSQIKDNPDEKKTERVPQSKSETKSSKENSRNQELDTLREDSSPEAEHDLEY
jgi:hypothetical protein